MRGLIVAAVILLGGCGDQQQQPSPVLKQKSNSSAIPEDVSYSIIDRQIIPGVKRSLTVRLNKRVSEEVLRTIAETLKSKDPRPYERTFICYLLPGMKLNAGAWASTHYVPTLEIKIYGTSIEEHGRILNVAESTPPAGTMGRWIASDRTGFPGIITFRRRDDAVTMIHTFADGSEGQYPLVLQEVDGEERYIQPDRKTSDYLVILPNGDLGHGDDEGIWTTSRKVKSRE